MYRFFNANRFGARVNDCVVRSISLAEGNSWDTTYDKLSQLAKEKGTLLDDVNFVEEYLDERYKRACHRSKIIKDFIKEHPVGIYLITMPNHITCCIDGTLFDTFDCTNREMWCSWEIDR